MGVKTVIFVLACLFAFGAFSQQANRPGAGNSFWVSGVLKPAAAGGGGGSTVEYYYPTGTASNQFTTVDTYFWNTYSIGEDIEITNAATITAVGVKCEETCGSANALRISLWTNSAGRWWLHECNEITLAASAAAAWRDTNLTVQLGVSAGTSVRVHCVISNNGCSGSYRSATTGGLRTEFAFASGCTTNERAGADNSNIGVRAKVLQ